MDIHELKASLIDLKSRLDEIKENVFKITSKKKRLLVIDDELSKEEVWSDLELSQKCRCFDCLTFFDLAVC